ncbi:hypothetical protein JTE88_07950 [Arcanobacterium phocisimile]|uniref:Uncharacterized protein n=1 Tax=Arcanobacterium phocisimile TaxID=1302235 RepID=A0ABX7IIR9_9ACTO|nr:hypothetical protein [Arcanobacterium phocisimile]QRV02000.1 hypothetical protein JTE88_07950 [Arcanobacterium phocisimile]
MVRLSRVDAQRLARGEFSAPEEALHVTDAGPVMQRSKTGVVQRSAQPQALSPHERELIENLPPHFGKI